ncbi:MAG: DUF4340 domain-containing protein [Roseburia sp.]|nr:DUF4340 domain-containing protein [Roseburia sp.]
MKRQKVQMFLLVLALALLGAAFFGLQKYNEAQEEKEAAGTDTIPVVELASEEIVRISYEYEGETYRLEKRGDTWYDEEDESRGLTQYRITAIASRLASLAANQVITEVTDMEQYGLAEGYRRVSFETAGVSYIFYLGDQNPITSDYYICKPSERCVYAVDSNIVSQFDYTLEELTDNSSAEG